MSTIGHAVLSGALALLSTVGVRAESVDRWGTIAPEAIVSVATGDFDRDGESDAAMLVLPESEDAGGSTLYVFLQNATEEAAFGMLSPVLRVENAAWGTAPLMPGQVPRLLALANGSFQIVTMNHSIGRSAWEQTVTLAYRDGAFRVAGFTYTSYDRLQEEDPTDCDLNLFAGSGVLNGAAATFEASPTPFEDWSDETGYGICELE